MKNIYFATVCAICFSAFTSTHAAVTLSIEGPTAPAVVGSNLNFTVSLNSSGEQTIGLDYFLQVSSSGSGFFAIADRNISGSSYSDPFFSDTIVEAPPSNVLDPSNDNDLGALKADVSTPNGAGTFFVGTYSIRIASNTPFGSYTFSTFSLPGTGYVDQNFSDNEFDQHGAFTVTVIPEPSTAAFFSFAAAAFALRRRR